MGNDNKSKGFEKPSEFGDGTGVSLKSILETIKKETRPVENHTDPKALIDCWNIVFEYLEKLDKLFISKEQVEKIIDNIPTHNRDEQDLKEEIKQKLREII